MPTMSRTELASSGGSGASRSPVRVLLVDDHAIIRQGLRSLLAHRSDIEVVGEASDGREAVRLARRVRPDVVLMDVVMPGLNGIEAAARIHQEVPSTRVLMLSGYSDTAQVLGAVRAGASGYVRKAAQVDEVVLAIQAVAHGNTYFSTELLGGVDTLDLIQTAHQPGGGALDCLSQREREVLQLIGEGYTNREIADVLNVTVKTVEAHITRIIQKLGIRRRGDLIRFAVRAGIAPLESIEPVSPAKGGRAV